jgi:site-specific DNA-cytosine methylase
MIPNKGGVFIDSYNQSVNEEISGTITTRIDASNMSYVTEPKIIERNTPMKGNYTEPRICTMVGRDPNNPSSRARSDHYEQFLEMGDDVSNTLTSVQKDNLVAEPNVLTPKRTDFGKQVRKQYESGELDMSRHDMTELEPRTDGVSNTLTSVQKDNLLAEPLRIPQATKQGYIEVQEGGVFDGSYPTSTTRRGRVQEGGEVSPTLTTSGDNINRYEGMQVEQIDDKIVETTYRIRKLTPRECFRLMGVEDKDIDTIQASGVSNSQQYKMAGNSIVVDCLYHLLLNRNELLLN